VVSVALIQMPTSSTKADERLADYPLPSPAEIWTPEIPNKSPKWSIRNPPPAAPFQQDTTSQDRQKTSQQRFNFCLNMNFGGPEGQFLRSLTRVSVFMGSCPVVFMGMTFMYKDGSQRAFGQRRYLVNGADYVSTTEKSFAIDGPGGENFIKVETSYNPEEQTIQEISVSTHPSYLYNRKYI
jgi:hypothetical protein